MNIKKLVLFTFTCLLTSQASAHSRWLLPSHFTLSSDKGEWIALDASASNETFNVDKALSIDNLSIIMPSGKKSRPSSVYKGHRKTVADYFIEKSGTYKLASNSQPFYFSSFKVGGERKRMRGNKLELQNKLPANATDVQTVKVFSRVETYITMNNPTNNFATDGRSLELIPVTHPSEIVEQEPATFTFNFNGKAQAGVEVEVTMDGARYRNNPETVKLTTDNKGQITFTPKQAGRYLLIAEYMKAASDNSMADKEKGDVFLTFEAQLQ